MIPYRSPVRTGQLQPLRIANVIRAQEPVFPGINVPQGKLWTRTQLILNFAGGLPLRAGQLYTWRAQIDGNDDPRWSVSFFIPAPPPPPVMG